MKVRVGTHYHAMNWRPCGACRPCQQADPWGCWVKTLAWEIEGDNLVVTEGLNLLLTRSFKTVPANVDWFVGLKGTGTVVAGDTLASHAGWAEINPYAGNRPAWTAGTVSAGSVDNSAAKASYSINASTTVFGAFLATVNTGTSGTLYGAADFTASRAVVSGDTLQVQATITAAAA